MENGILRARIGEENYKKLSKINNSALYEFIGKYIELCNPAKVFVCDDTTGDISYIREMALKNGEERPLATPSHTIHFDALGDQDETRNTPIFLFPKDSCSVRQSAPGTEKKDYRKFTKSSKT